MRLGLCCRVESGPTGFREVLTATEALLGTFPAREKYLAARRPAMGSVAISQDARPCPITFWIFSPGARAPQKKQIMLYHLEDILPHPLVDNLKFYTIYPMCK